MSQDPPSLPPMPQHVVASEPVAQRPWIHPAPSHTPIPTLIAPELTMAWVGSAQTVSIWILAFFPFMGPSLAVTVFVISGLILIGPGVDPWVAVIVPFLLALLAPLGLAIGLAAMDASTLRRRGFRPASAGWILLFTPLVYFIARALAVRRDGGRTWPAGVTFALVVLFTYGGSVLSLVTSPDFQALFATAAAAFRI